MSLNCLYRLSVSIVNRPKFNEGKEGLFALFDGGRNDEVTRILANRITALLEDEFKDPITNHEYLKYTLLSAHRYVKLSSIISLYPFIVIVL